MCLICKDSQEADSGEIDEGLMGWIKEAAETIHVHDILAVMTGEHSAHYYYTQIVTKKEDNIYNLLNIEEEYILKNIRSPTRFFAGDTGCNGIGKQV